MPDTGLDVKILRLLAAGETRSASIADALSKSRRMLQDYLTGLRAHGLPVPLLLGSPRPASGHIERVAARGVHCLGPRRDGSGHSL